MTDQAVSIREMVEADLPEATVSVPGPAAASAGNFTFLRAAPNPFEASTSVVFDLAHRISVLVYGEIIASGPPAEIRKIVMELKRFQGMKTILLELVK